MQNIIVPVSNFDVSLRALEYAGMLSAKTEANITVLHLVDPHKIKSKDELRMNLNLLIETKIRPHFSEAVRNNPNLKKIKIETKALTYEVSDHILDFAGDKQADLIVMGSHGLPPADRWERHLKDTNAYKVVLEATCPVLTFTSIPKALGISKIVLPMDLSDGSQLKVPLAIQLASQFSAKVDILSVVDKYGGKQETQSRALQQSVSQKFTSHEIPTNCTIRKGDALSEISLKYSAEINADLMIIMNRPSSMWADLLVSPGAQRIISFSKIPVLSLRAKDRDVDL